MALAGDGVLAIWNGIAPEAEAEFLRWHVEEHIPERVAVPGFLRARRYVAERGTPRYFNFYETQSPADLSSTDYLARLDAPSDWTKAVVRHFRDTSRTVCRVRGSHGLGDGSHVATFRMTTALEPDAFVEALGGALGSLLARPGLVSAHLLQGEAAAGGQATAEKALRDSPDGQAAWILLLEAVGAEPLLPVVDEAAEEVLAAAGASCPQAERGVYRLQYALSRSQIDDRR